jgi:hypothetical protein
MKNFSYVCMCAPRYFPCLKSTSFLNYQCIIPWRVAFLVHLLKSLTCTVIHIWLFFQWAAYLYRLVFMRFVLAITFVSCIATAILLREIPFFNTISHFHLLVHQMNIERNCELLFVHKQDNPCFWPMPFVLDWISIIFKAAPDSSAGNLFYFNLLPCHLPWIR